MRFDVCIYKRMYTNATDNGCGNHSGGSRGRKDWPLYSLAAGMILLLYLCRRRCCRCSDTAEKWGGKNHWTTSNALSNSWATTPLPTVTSTPRSLKLGVFTTVASDLLFVYFLLIYIYVYNNIHIFLIFFFFWSRRNVFFITHGAAARDLEANIICMYTRVYGVGYSNRIRMMYTRSIIM